MSEEQSKPFTALLSLFPLILLLAIEGFIYSLSSTSYFLPHLTVVVFAAQLVSLIVFMKGEICPGQRGRLVKATNYFAIYWLAVLLINLTAVEHYTLTYILSICGLTALYAIWKQPKEPVARKSFLMMASFISALGLMGSLMIFTKLSSTELAQFNPFAQIVAGVLLANLALVIARNRVHKFIALLPMLIIVFLAFNAFTTFGFLLFKDIESAVNSEAILAYVIYFILHLVITGILALYVFRQWKLSYNSLIILFFMALSLPVWMMFV